MKKVIFALFLLPLFSDAQYILMRNNPFTMSSERWINNSPGFTIGQSRVVESIKDSTEWRFLSEKFIFTALKLSANAGTPLSLAWFDDTGRVYRSAPSSLPLTAGQITAGLAFTPAPVTRNITINGTTQTLAADRTWSVGTVTNVTSANAAHLTVVTGTTAPVITMVSAPKITTARNINGVAFDGTADITINASPNISFVSAANAVTMGTAFRPRAGGPCEIVITSSLSGILGLNETITVAISPTLAGTYTTLQTDVLLIGLAGLSLVKSTGTIPVPYDITNGGWYVKISRSGSAASATYSLFNY